MNESFPLTRTIMILLALPVGAFAAYITWLIVPAIVATVVPAVVRAIFGA